MEFANGAIGEITTSFDVWHSQVPPILIYGTEGSLSVPDPNGFGGEPKIRLRGDSEWQPLPVKFGFTGNSRGVGVLDMAVAIRENRPHRASGALAFHVLDAMHAFHESSDQRRHIDLSVGLEKPEIMARDQYSDLI
jgi:predicted dehydrogenase